MATRHLQDLPNTNLLATLPISALNEIYSSLLCTTLGQNDPSSKSGIATKGPITRFHSKVPPPLPVQDYLARLTKFTPYPRDALLLSSVYLNRISHLALPTAYCACESFTDDPTPPRNSSKTPQPLIPSCTPPRPEPILVLSPFLSPVVSTSTGSTTTTMNNSNRRSSSSGSLPPFFLSPPLQPSSSSSSTSSSYFSNSSSSAVALSTSPSSPTPTSPSSPKPTTTLKPHRVRPAPLLNLFTLHRLVLSTLLISTKYSVDGTLSQTRAAKVGGVTKTELTRLEAETLRLLEWSLYVDKQEMENVFKVWVDRGKELGVVPTRTSRVREEEEDDDERTPKIEGRRTFESDRDEKEEEKVLRLPSSPPKPIVALGGTTTTNQHLELPLLHATVSNNSTNSCSSSTTRTDSTSSSETNTSVSSLTSSPTTTTMASTRIDVTCCSPDSNTPIISPPHRPDGIDTEGGGGGGTDDGCRETPTNQLEKVNLND